MKSEHVYGTSSLLTVSYGTRNIVFNKISTGLRALGATAPSR